MISQCNLIYKVTSKVISNRSRNVLSSNISREQFGFLSGRVIHDAIRVAQVAIHSIKTKMHNIVILEVDLVKAYDRVNWGFLRIFLLHFGLDLQVTNWTMGYISSANFVVLVNGSPSTSSQHLEA